MLTETIILAIFSLLFIMPLIESLVFSLVVPPIVVRGLGLGFNILADRMLRYCDIPENEIDEYRRRREINAAEADGYRQYYNQRRTAEANGVWCWLPDDLRERPRPPDSRYPWHRVDEHEIIVVR